MDELAPADASPLGRTLAVLQAGIADQLHLGGQIYVSLRGQVIVDQGVGQARLGAPMSADSICLLLSSGKPITAVAVLQLCEHKRLTLDSRVADVIPEFAQGGKEHVTIRNLLIHTGGLRTADKCDLGRDWDEIIDCVCRTPLEPHWALGRQAAYHPSGSWYALGEVVRRVVGQPFDEHVRREVLGPAGISECWLALPPRQLRAYGDRVAFMYHTETAPPSPHRRWNTEEDASVCRPGRNARGPVRDLGRFYENLLACRAEKAPAAGTALLTAEMAREMTARQRDGVFDDTFQQVIDWGLGVAIDSKRHGREMVSYGFGRFASEEAFGHGGSQSSCAFADPAHELVVAWAVNGLPGERRHQARSHAINTAIYEDLNLI